MSVATEPSTSSSIQLSQQCRRFELSDIMLATENFDESLVIGKGGFGKVYIGTIFNGSATVLAAIKRLDPNSNQGAPEFWAEVEMLSKLRHGNLVSLFGYCNDEEEMILVYEYMPNGTLDDHLHKLGTPLSWVQLLKICIGAGRGLQYLHTGTGIDVGVIHRDVKTSNILLQESWAAKISDFGLSKIGPTNQPVTYVNTRVKGTFGYFDPDYYATGNLTRKSDVFAFGVVLLEVLCRKRAVFDIDGEALNLAIWAQESIKEGNLKNIVDIDIRGQVSQKCLKKFVRIAERCLHTNPKHRSTMAEVVVNLEDVLSKQKKFSNSVQPADRTIPDRMVNMLPFPSNGENTGIPSSSSIQLSQQCCRFELSDIILATRNFDKSLVIGRGGFGKVYRGTIFNGSATVLAAIKRLDPNSNQGAPEFWAEVEMLSKLRHGNLVSLFGYCNDEEEMILVYEYMPNGTLEAHLHKLDTPLSWVQLLKICIGAGRGLDYLHTGTGIDVGVIHRDFKTSNILIQESWAAKISDFGVSKIGPTNQPVTYVNTLVKGTFGYFDPDYYATGNLTRKSDVFAFGVVLLEVLCRKRAVFDIDGEASNLAIWAQESIKEGNLKNIVDIDLRGEISSKCLKEFVQIAERCLHGNPKQRSTMAEVLVSLEAVLTLQEKFNNPVQPAGRTILDRMVNMLPFPSNGESTGTLSANQSATYLSRYEDEEDLEVHLGQLKRFSLHELQVATRKFSDRHVIGRGGFGKVHKGLLADGTLVAVKRLTEERTQGLELQFQTEVEMRSYMAVHRNLFRLIGFCTTPTEQLLVYPYMANGSVGSWLRERPDTQEPLDWLIRKRIALGSARGLACMHDHCDSKIIHRNVKASCILLDEEFEALVGDFRFVKLMDHEDTQVTTTVCGTSGYIAPEYLLTGKVSEKIDVFGYGVMLLELITGQRTFDHARLDKGDDVMLLDWVKGRFLREKKLETVVDGDLRGNYIDDEVEQLIHVAVLCTQGSPSERPKMSEVVRMLEGDGLAERWEEWQKDELPGQEFNTTYNPNTDWIVDSTYNLNAENLSGPR